MDAARVRADLTLQDLWLRYLALGGVGDAFDLDGYLQGLIPLEAFQQDVLAQSLNEALDDVYRAHRIPLSAPALDDEGDAPLLRLAEDLLRDRSRAPPPEPESSAADSA
jgi:hypothetical protein